MFVIPNLGGGGAERALIHLLRHLDRGRYAPCLALFEVTGVHLAGVPKDVPLFDMAKRSRYDFFALQYRLSRIVKDNNVDAVVSLINYTNVVTLASRALFRWRRPVIVCEHTSLGPSLPAQRFSSIKKLLIGKLYPRAEAVIAVSEGVKKDMVGTVSVPSHKIYVIHNPVDIDMVFRMATDSVGDARSEVAQITAAGRLTSAKDYPTLLRAFRKVRESREAKLTILGEGPERRKLESLCRDLGIDASVSFPGFVTNPYGYMAQADLFVVSSAWEGFGYVIAEAMACGTAVVSTDCPSGPGEIIKDGVNGLLVPVGDEKALARAILKLLGDDQLREKLAGAGAKRAMAYRVDNMAREYEALIEDVIRRHGNE